jgi:YfiH family protein
VPIRDAQGVYRSTLLSKIPSLVHGFGTARTEGWIREYTGVKQIHSDIVVTAGAADGAAGDALITNEAGRMVGVRTADCVPILIADPEHRAVAAIHAGWKGTVADIAGKTVRRMQAEFGSRPEELIAAIGPGIGECCFEVGPEVTRAFAAIFPDWEDRDHIDLIEANIRLLVAAGLERRNIDAWSHDDTNRDTNLCTKCSEEFHSFRRDKEQAGRMVSAIGYKL